MGFKAAGTYEAPETVNPYIDDIAGFAEQNADNPNAQFEIDVPAKEQSRHEGFIRKAANLAGKTARLRKVDDSGVTVVGKTEKGREIKEGTVILTYTLSEQHKAGQGRKPAEAAEEAPKVSKK